MSPCPISPTPTRIRLGTRGTVSFGATIAGGAEVFEAERANQQLSLGESVFACFVDPSSIGHRRKQQER